MPAKVSVSGNLEKSMLPLNGTIQGSRGALAGDLPGTLVLYAPEKKIPKYIGPYAVTPTPEEQILQTNGKLMEVDTTIKAIPVYEVSNTAGGTTVFIASEV